MIKERGRQGKPSNLFVCFRPPCSHPLPDRDDSFKKYRENKRQPAKDSKVMSIEGAGVGKVCGDRGGNEEKMPAKPWSSVEPAVSYISLHLDGHNSVIQTPAEIPLSATSRRKTAHAAFAKVFNAIAFRNSTNSAKDTNSREMISSTYERRRSWIHSVSNRSKGEKKSSLSPASSSISSAISTDHSSAASSLGSSRTSSMAWSDSAGEDRHQPEDETCSLTGTSKSSKERQYYYLHEHVCESLPSLALCLLMLSTLSMMILLGKPCAIIWTTSWLYMAAPQYVSSAAPHSELGRGVVGTEQGRLERSRSGA